MRTLKTFILVMTLLCVCLLFSSPLYAISHKKAERRAAKIEKIHQLQEEKYATEKTASVLRKNIRKIKSQKGYNDSLAQVMRENLAIFQDSLSKTDFRINEIKILLAKTNGTRVCKPWKKNSAPKAGTAAKANPRGNPAHKCEGGYCGGHMERAKYMTSNRN